MLSAHCKLNLIHPHTHIFTREGPVILMLRSYAFSGRRRPVLVVLSAFFLSLLGVVIWVMSVQLRCLSF
jgi:hypothetical protein